MTVLDIWRAASQSAIYCCGYNLWFPVVALQSFFQSVQASAVCCTRLSVLMWPWLLVWLARGPDCLIPRELNDLVFRATGVVAWGNCKSPVLIHHVHCTIQTVQSNCCIFLPHPMCMVPGTSTTIREGCVPVGASHGKRITYKRLNADLYSWEYKGGACKSVIRRVMYKPYIPGMHHVSISSCMFLLAQVICSAW